MSFREVVRSTAAATEISMPDHDRIEGAAKNLGGNAKEATGKVIGD